MRGQNRQAVRADLVGGVAVARDPVRADDHQVDAAPLIAIAAAPSTINVASTPARSSSKYVSRAPCKQRTRLVHEHVRISSPRVALRYHAQRRAAAGGRDRSGVAVRQHARPLADQFQAGLGDRAIDDALLVVNGFGFFQHVVATRSTRSTAHAKFTAVGRASRTRAATRANVRVVGLARAEQRDAVRAEHADARRPAHRQGRDRIHDLVHRRSPLVPDRVRKRALIQIAQFAVLKDDGFERRAGHGI